jgi:HPt (histidine-containing phosphotransfer) domain-containing protein
MQFESYTDVHTENTDEKLYDLCMIEHLCRGKKEKVNKMVMLFIDDIPKTVSLIKLAYEQSDFATIKNLAHKIKPTLSYYAVVKLEKDMKQIEKLALEGQKTEELGLKINKLESVIHQIVDDMKKNILY